MEYPKRTHREWRRQAKKERRRRLRRRAAAERDADERRLRATLESSADYLNWIKKQEEERIEREATEKVEREAAERLWLEEEVRARKEWQLLQERKQRARQQQLEQESKIREEFEAKQETIRQKQEEEKLKREEEMRKREQLLKEIDDYIDNGVKTPEALRDVVDSQPGKELCPFFTKTGACRYGDTCSRNHRRVCLSKVVLVPGFYSHFSLEKNSAEYDTDVGLEFESSETRQHFREFYKDVVPELESFGRIKTLKYCCNTEIHLRGNLYVEYYTEREAARAVRKLKGRWYAGRQLNCEFANLKSWRSAVCGMVKCPKGRACNFLHTFKNPHDEYDIKSPPRWAKQVGSNHETASTRRTEHRSKSKWEDTGSDAEEDKNWRWSESPEVELEHRSRDSEQRHGRRRRRRRRSDERDRQKSARDRREAQSDKDKSSDIETRRRSTSKKNYEKSENDETNGRDSRYSSKYRRREKTDYDDSKSSKRPRKSHSRNSDTSYPSSSHQYDNKKTESCRKKFDSERDRYETTDDGVGKKTSKTGKSERDDTVARVKSKWDKEEPERTSSEDTDSTGSDSSANERPSKQRKAFEKSDDEWATTDSENESKNKTR